MRKGHVPNGYGPATDRQISSPQSQSVADRMAIELEETKNKLREKERIYERLNNQHE